MFILQKSKNKLEMLSPILTVLLQMSRQQRVIRKFLRYRILPPLKDVMNRPEEGESFRAKLCRQLTSPSSTIKDLTAEFLFTLCKESGKYNDMKAVLKKCCVLRRLITKSLKRKISRVVKFFFIFSWPND